MSHNLLSVKDFRIFPVYAENQIGSKQLKTEATNYK